MAIDLSVRRRGAPPEEARLVPIATHEVFRTGWEPGAAALGLVWVPLFTTGIPIESEDISDVLSELERLGTWLEGIGGEDASGVLSRLNTLKDELVALQERGDIDIYVG